MEEAAVFCMLYTIIMFVEGKGVQVFFGGVV